MRCLGVCLFYNDEDIASDAIEHLLKNNHDVIVFDNLSTDRTREIVEGYGDDIISFETIPRVELREVFRIVSRRIMALSGKYDWVSFPESDEFLEGPDRTKSYYDHLLDVYESPYDWVEFSDMVFWFTEKDDGSIVSPVGRIKHYAEKQSYLRVFSWRASASNIRVFNHNKAHGDKYPTRFNSRHYQVRSFEHLLKRLYKRSLPTGGRLNHHHEYMQRVATDLLLHSNQLHFDNGLELISDKKFDWFSLYGDPDELMRLRESGRYDSEEELKLEYGRRNND